MVAQSNGNNDPRQHGRRQGSAEGMGSSLPRADRSYEATQIVRLHRCEIHFNLEEFGGAQIASDVAVVVTDDASRRICAYRLEDAGRIYHQLLLADVLKNLNIRLSEPNTPTTEEVLQTLAEAVKVANRFGDEDGIFEFAPEDLFVRAFEVPRSPGHEPLAVVYRELPEFEELLESVLHLDSRFEIHLTAEGGRPNILTCTVNHGLDLIHIDAHPDVRRRLRTSGDLDLLPITIPRADRTPIESQIREIAATLAQGGLQSLDHPQLRTSPLHAYVDESRSSSIGDPASDQFYHRLTARDKDIYDGRSTTLAQQTALTEHGSLISLTFGNQLASLQIAASPHIESANMTWRLIVKEGERIASSALGRELKRSFNVLTSTSATFDGKRAVIDGLILNQKRQSQLLGPHMSALQLSTGSEDFLTQFDPAILPSAIDNLEVVMFRPVADTDRELHDQEYALGLLMGAEPVRFMISPEAHPVLAGNVINYMVLFVAEHGIAFRAENLMKATFSGYVPSVANGKSLDMLGVIARLMSESAKTEEPSLQRYLETICYHRRNTGAHLIISNGAPQVSPFHFPSYPTTKQLNWYFARLIPRGKSPNWSQLAELHERTFKEITSERQQDYLIAGRLVREGLRLVNRDNNGRPNYRFNVVTVSEPIGFQVILPLRSAKLSVSVQNGSVRETSVVFEPTSIGSTEVRGEQYRIKSSHRTGIRDPHEQNQFFSELILAISSLEGEHMLNWNHFTLRDTAMYRLLVSYFGERNTRISR